ncbi:MAG TPA: hypothetical protein VL688_02385 [Verrucomicrobiae bacterium]|jgi:hypothetical protein|nr:hypothetical protein [Verrucomicrobiae bacterium]
MVHKDRLFLGFAFSLSVVIGAAAALSLKPADVQTVEYQFLNPLTGKIVDVKLLARDEEDFKSILTKDTGVLALRSPATANPLRENSRFIHLNTRTETPVQPYLSFFFRGFILIWMIYFAVNYLVKHLIVREFRETLNRERKTRRGRKR